MKEPLVSRLLKYTLCLIFLIGVVVTVTLPFALNYYTLWLYDVYYIQPAYQTFLLLFLIVVGALGLWIIADLIFILNTVPKDPFVQRNVRALRRIGTVAIAISLLFLLKCLYYFTFLTAVCALVLLVCALIVFTVCMLFSQAVRYKEENDLTI